MTIGNSSFQIGGKTCTFAEFGPDELGQAAGLSPALESAWRQWGYMPWGQHKPKAVSAVTAVETAVSHRLALHGVLPSEIGRLCCGSVALLFWYAFLNVNGSCEVAGMPDEVDDFLCKFYNNHRLAAELTGVSRKTAYQYLYRHNGLGQFERALNLKHIIGTEIATNYEIVDLARIAEEFCVAAKRPLLYVELTRFCTPKSRWIKRLTHRL